MGAFGFSASLGIGLVVINTSDGFGSQMKTKRDSLLNAPALVSNKSISTISVARAALF